MHASITNAGCGGTAPTIPLYEITKDLGVLRSAPGAHRLLRWPPAPDDVDENRAPVWTGTVSNGGLGVGEVLRAQTRYRATIREGDGLTLVWIHNAHADCWHEIAIPDSWVALLRLFATEADGSGRIRLSGKPEYSQPLSRLRQLGLVISVTPDREYPGAPHFREAGYLYCLHTPVRFAPPPPEQTVVLDETRIRGARTLRRVEKALNTLLRKDVRLPDTPRHRNNAAKLARKLERFAQGKGGDR